MNDASAEASVGWGSSQPKKPARIRRRDIIPPLVAVFFLTLAHLLFGATEPMPALVLSICLIAAALASIAMSGPRHVTAGMISGAGLIWLLAVTGAAGGIDRAAPDLAVLFAAGAMWAIGYIAARKRGALDIVWAGLIWTSFAYCAWMFFSQMGAVLSGSDSATIADSFGSPASASLLFGMFTLIGSARLFHVVKQMDAEALARSEMIDRLIRDALGGILLLVFAITCLTLTGSRVGVILTAAVLLGHAWWDTRAIASRTHRGLIIKIGSRIAPLAAIGLAVWGVGLAWLRDESVSPGLGLSDTLPHLQRLQAYAAAWLEQPLFGHGLGSIDVIGDRSMTLVNAKAMLAPGGAQNVFVHWLVEAGAAGLAALLIFVGAMHIRIAIALNQRPAPRTFMRLAFAASMLMLLHGVSDSSLDLPGVVWLYALLLGAACGVATAKSSRSSGNQG
jgi:O-antigen ligase